MRRFRCDLVWKTSSVLTVDFVEASTSVSLSEYTEAAGEDSLLPRRGVAGGIGD